MVKNFVKKVKKTLGRLKQAAFATVHALVIAYMLSPIPVYAGDYLAPINNFKNVALAVVGSLGGCVLVYGIVKFGESFLKKDQNGEFAALYTIGAGAIFLGGSILVGVITG